MKRKLITVTLIVAITVLFLAFAQFTYAQTNLTPKTKQTMQQQTSNQFREMLKKRADNNPSARMKKIIESLDLTKEQITEIRKMDLNFQKNTLELRNKVQANQLDIEGLFLDAQPDMVKIRAKLQEIANLQVELKIKSIEEYSAVKGILTPEQQEKLPEGIPFQMLTLEKFVKTARMLKNFSW